MLLSLKTSEAEALARELDGHVGDPQIDAVKAKLARSLGPQVPDPIPGQTTIDDHLEAA